MIKPLQRRIFIKKDEMPANHAGIILPKAEGSGQQQVPPYSGIITGIGTGVEDTDYAVGMKVLFHEGAGVEVPYDNSIVFFIYEIDICGIIENNIVVS